MNELIWNSIIRNSDINEDSKIEALNENPCTFTWSKEQERRCGYCLIDMHPIESLIKL